MHRQIAGIIVLLSVLVVPLQTVYAEEPLEVIFGGISYHLISEDTTTWFHRALILKKGNYLGGYLRNSYGQDSFVAAYRVLKEEWPIATGEVSLGVVKGYDKCYGRRPEAKKKVWGCFIPIFTLTGKTDTKVKPQVNLWGDALVLTAKYTF